jgi:anthranilate synthase component 2
MHDRCDGLILFLFWSHVASSCASGVLAGEVVRAPCGVMHGKTSPVFHTDKGVLQGLEK